MALLLLIINVDFFLQFLMYQTKFQDTLGVHASILGSFSNDGGDAEDDAL